MKKLIAIAIAVALLLATAVTVPLAASTEWHVNPGDPLDSIQAAVDSASPGDTITVHAGVYHQQWVVISTNDITLKGEEGTILDGAPPPAPQALPLPHRCAA